MGDSDDTPPQRPGKRPASSWGDDERAEVGREHRGAESAKAGKRARRDAVHPLEFPVLVPPPDLVERELGGPGEVDAREITEPWEILDREELTPEEKGIIARSRRDSKDPLLVEDGAKIWRRVLRTELDERSKEKRLADRFLELIKNPPHEATAQLQRDVAEIKRHLAPYLGARRRFRKWLGGGAIGALLAVGAWLYARGRADESAAARQQQSDQRLERIEHFIFVPPKGFQP